MGALTLWPPRPRSAPEILIECRRKSIRPKQNARKSSWKEGKRKAKTEIKKNQMRKKGKGIKNKRGLEKKGRKMGGKEEKGKR